MRKNSLKAETKTSGAQGLCLSHGEIVERLVKAGVNPTSQRIAICEFVLCTADHPTAEDVKAWADARFSTMSLATVYNTLNLLVEARLLREFKFPHSEKVIYDSNVNKHYHFYDEDLDKVFDLPIDDVEIVTKLGRNYRVSNIDVVITGSKKK